MSVPPTTETQANHRRPSPVSTSRSTTLLILAALWCILWFFHSRGYWEDDSFIHLEFARSLAAGHGFSFNGTLVYGDTAPLWVLLLAGAHLLIPGWLAGGKVLAILGVIFALTGVYAFSRRLIPADSTGETFPATMVLLTVLNPYFCYWSFSGMETITAAGLALWGVVAATSPATPALAWDKFLLACVIAGLAPLLRPELVFYAAILGLLLLYRRFLVPSAEPLTRKLAGFTAGLLLLVGPTLVWALYALHAFGRVVPNTNAAKRANIHASILLRLVNVYSLGFPIIVCAVLVGLIYLVLRFSRSQQRLNHLRQSNVFLAGGWIFVLWSLITAVFYVINHTYIQTRYIVVTATGLTIVVMASILFLSRSAYRFALAAALTLAAIVSLSSVWPFIRNKNIYVEAVRQQALFFRNQLPPNAPVADYDIGEVAFFSQHPIIDTGGITRPGVIPFLEDHDAMIRWVHSQSDSSDGIYFVSLELPEPGAVMVLSQRIPFIGWSLDPRRYSAPDYLNTWKLPPNAPTPLSPAR